LASKRVRAEVEEGQAPKPRLPSCLVGATPEINSSVLQARGNRHAAGGTGALTVAVLGEETDPHRLRQRQKQVDYGKNTLGYDRYTQLVPKERRRRADPKTPDIHARISTKRFNGLVRAWRRRLHEFDPKETMIGTSHFSFSSSPSSSNDLPQSGGPSYAAVVKTPGSSSRPHSHSHDTPNRGDSGGGMHAAEVHDDDSSDGLDGQEIIITQEGGPGSTGGKGRDKKKSRMSPFDRPDAGSATEEEVAGGCVGSDFPALVSGAAVASDGDQVARRWDDGEEGGEADFYKIKRSMAMGAGLGGDYNSGSFKNAEYWGDAQRLGDDEELCYSDDDLL